MPTSLPSPKSRKASTQYDKYDRELYELPEQYRELAQQVVDKKVEERVDAVMQDLEADMEREMSDQKFATQVKMSKVEKEYR